MTDTRMTREQARAAIDDALFERHVCDPNIDFPCWCPYPDDAISFLCTEMERLERALADAWPYIASVGGTGIPLTTIEAAKQAAFPDTEEEQDA